MAYSPYTGTLNTGTINTGTFVMTSGTLTTGTINTLSTQTAGISGTWTSSTGTTDLQLTLNGYPTIAALINQTAGVTGGSIKFEASDPAGNWYPVEMMAANGVTTVTTYALQSSTNVGFQMNVAGFTKFRARLSDAITGTATVITTLVANSSAAEWAQFVTGGQLGTIGTIQAGTITALASGTITTGTVSMTTGTLNGGTLTNLATGTINALTSGTITGGTLQNLVSGTINSGTVAVTAGTIMGTWTESTGSATAGTTDIIASTDVSNYRWGELQITNTWVGTINLQTSNDNSNFNTQLLYQANATNVITNVTSNNNYFFPINSRFLRVRMNAFTSGTAQGVLELNTLPSAIITNSTSSAQSGAWSVTVGSMTAGTITGGTLGNLNYGTVTIDPTPVKLGTSYGTVGTTGAAAWGTIIAASGAGTKQYVSGVDIVGVSGTCEVVVTNIGIGGSTGAGVLARTLVVPGGGVSKTFTPIIPSGTNGTLSFWMSTAGTADITIQYWQGV